MNTSQKSAMQVDVDANYPFGRTVSIGLLWKLFPGISLTAVKSVE